MKKSFFSSSSLAFKLAIAVLVSIVLMTADHRFNQFHTARATMSLAVYPIQYMVHLPVSLGFWISETISSRNHLLAENQAFREQHLLYRARLQKLSALRQENIRLRELLKSSAQFTEERLGIAELLAVSIDPFKQQVVLNKGSRDGVYVGQPLLDAHGVMGQIIRVNPVSSTAILISDVSHALPVQVNRNGLRTIAVGTGIPEKLNLQYIPTSADIRIGDVVSTSGLGGVYPSDYPVAEVISVRIVTGEPFTIVEARPLARLDRSRNVLLVWERESDSGALESKVAQPPQDRDAEASLPEAVSSEAASAQTAIPEAAAP